MRDIPMLYSAPMVRALWNDRKTQTRRIITSPKWAHAYEPMELEDDGLYAIAKVSGCLAKVPIKYAVGDRLWVRENVSAYDDVEADSLALIYEADGHKISLGGRHSVSEDVGEKWFLLHAYRTDNPDIDGGKPVPSIHMPRWASRMTLIVADVRIERLQAISEADAIAEGIERHHSGWMPYSTAFYEADGITPANHHLDPRESYRSLWNKINGPGSWEANPWVVAVTFDVIKRNIGEVK